MDHGPFYRHWAARDCTKKPIITFVIFWQETNMTLTATQKK
jgi:hypothetical protein